jgi:WhiB family redox-sensing transcriptional regulator
MNVYTEALLTPEPWTQDALCAQTDPDAWFPEPGEGGRAAKKICNRCPVRNECLEYALRTNQQAGIWGGVGEHERQRLRRRTA